MKPFLVLIYFIDMLNSILEKVFSLQKDVADIVNFNNC